MEPWLSWPIFLGIAGTAYYYYARPGQQRSARAQGRESSQKERQNKRQDTPSASTAREVKTSARAESSQGKKRKQQKDQPTTTTSISNVGNKAPIVSEPEPEVEDREWAKQLQAAKQGVTMKTSTKPSEQGASTKSTKQRDAGTLNAQESNEKMRSEDQISHTNRLPASQDVSDMLEPAPAGPSAIRITGEEKPKKQAIKKEEPAKETKKQRQNRRKVEERKAVREEDEKERKALEEKQRRAAREARGEPAKNGLGLSQPPASNVWSVPSANNAHPTQQQSAPPNENPLLDTFDHDARSTASSTDHQQNGHTPTTAASMSSQDLLSEEAQIDTLGGLDGDSGWSQVKKSKKGKKKVPASPPVESGVTEVKQAPFSVAAEPVNGTTKAPGLPAKTSEPANDYAPLQPAKNLQPLVKSHPDDSDWTVE